MLVATKARAEMAIIDSEWTNCPNPGAPAGWEVGHAAGGLTRLADARVVLSTHQSLPLIPAQGAAVLFRVGIHVHTPAQGRAPHLAWKTKAGGAASRRGLRGAWFGQAERNFWHLLEGQGVSNITAPAAVAVSFKPPPSSLRDGEAPPAPPSPTKPRREPSPGRRPLPAASAVAREIRTKTKSTAGTAMELWTQRELGERGRAGVGPLAASNMRVR